MPHIHDEIDFTAVAYVVYQDKVLMVHHKKLGIWLPPGGHIELDQDPEQALFNELREETGLTEEVLEVFGSKPEIVSPGTKFLYSPTFLDIHKISNTHRHIGMVYLLKSKTDQITLSEEHHEIRWFSASDIKDSKYNLLPSVKYYALESLKSFK